MNQVQSQKYWSFLLKRYNRSGDRVAPHKLPRWSRNDLYIALNCFGCKVGVEIGVREGLNAERLCKAIPGVKLICVDPWAKWPGHTDMKRHEDDPAKFLIEARARLAPYDVEFIQAYSQDAVRDIPDESLDFVYIDGDHTFDGTILDLVTWSRKVKPFGIISGHDFKYYRLNGVIPAVTAYTQAHRIHDWFITGEKQASYFWLKKG